MTAELPLTPCEPHNIVHRFCPICSRKKSADQRLHDRIAELEVVVASRDEQIEYEQERNEELSDQLKALFDRDRSAARRAGERSGATRRRQRDS